MGSFVVMAGRPRWQIPVLTVNAIVFSLLSCGSWNSAMAGSKAKIKITSPAHHSVVSGTVTIMTQEQAPISWMNVYADRQFVVSDGSARPYWVQWDSTRVKNGKHKLTVIGYNDANQLISQHSVVVKVSNQSGPAPSPTPNPGPTPTPVGGPTPTPVPPTSSSGATFYVSPSGSDSAAGTSSAPWRTIQKAADTLSAGQIAMVAGGNYGERVSITRSGTQSSPITLQVANGATAQLLGFDITGNSWIVSGFDISTQTNGTDGFGIYVSGSASYVTLQTNYIHELCHEGIFMDPGVTHVSVLNNRIWRAEMAGVSADGTYDLIQGNEVWGTQQYPASAGGIYAGCTIAGGADADAFRFFGQHNTFRSNYAHDIYTSSPTNPNPHTDCFQTWGSTAMQVDSILIERNTCRWPVASTSVDAEVAMIEGVDGLVGTVTIQNNQLSNMRQGIDVGHNVGAVKVYNNTWDHILQEALIFMDMRSPGDEVINNIFYDVGGGGDTYASVPSGAPVFQANCFYMPGGASVGTYPTAEPFMSIAPGFVNYGDATGGGADFHLSSGSGLLGAGIVLPQVTNDYYGNSRGTTSFSVGSAK
jgi:hypothetical protein